jgi:hypothetical protein
VERLTALYKRLGDSLVLQETFSAFDAELGKVMEYAAISVHLASEGALHPAYASGHGFRHLLDPEPEETRFLARAEHLLRPAMNELSGRSLAMAVPAVCDGHAAAVVALYRDPETPFRIEDMALLEDAAGKLGAAVANAAKFRRAQAAQARALFDRLDAEIARSRRTREGLAVLDCRTGPDELTDATQDAIAVELRACCREYDFVAVRPGGFVVVLIECGSEEMAASRDRVQMVFQRANTEVRIVSARYPDDGLNAEDLLAVADGAACV